MKLATSLLSVLLLLPAAPRHLGFTAEESSVTGRTSWQSRVAEGCEAVDAGTSLRWCGVRAVAVAAQRLGSDISAEVLNELISQKAAVEGIVSVEELCQAASRAGLHAVAIRADAEWVLGLTVPVVIIDRTSLVGDSKDEPLFHAKVLVQDKSGRHWVFDPAADAVFLGVDREQVLKNWSGTVIVFDTTAQQIRFNQYLDTLNVWSALLSLSLLCCICLRMQWRNAHATRQFLSLLLLSTMLTGCETDATTGLTEKTITFNETSHAFTETECLETRHGLPALTHTFAFQNDSQQVVRIAEVRVG